MVTLKNNTIQMPNPTQSTGWSDILKFIEDVTPFAMVFGLIWRGMDMVFKYFSARADERLKRIVHDEMNPTISDLTKAINELRESIWEMKSK